MCKFDASHVAPVSVFLLASESDSSVRSLVIKFRAVTRACDVCVVDGTYCGEFRYDLCSACSRENVFILMIEFSKRPYAVRSQFDERSVEGGSDVGC